MSFSGQSDVSVLCLFLIMGWSVVCDSAAFPCHFHLCLRKKDLRTIETYILKSFEDQLEGEEKAGCFAIIALQMYCYYK